MLKVLKTFRGATLFTEKIVDLAPGGVLLAIKSSSFTTSDEVNFGTDLELVTVEFISKSNLNYLVCSVAKLCEKSRSCSSAFSSAEGARFLGGSGGNFKNLSLEMAFLAI